MSLFSFLSSENDAKQIPEKRGVRGAYCELKDLMMLRWQAKTLALPSARRVSRSQIGNHRSRFRGRGMEFSEVRAYQAGDDVRSIDWRVTARRQKPHTKLFHEERERPIFIVCDQSQSMFFGSQVSFKSVRAAETAALFAWASLNHNDRAGGLIFSNQTHSEFKPSQNRKVILNFLNELAHFNQSLNIGDLDKTGSVNLNNSLRETVRLAKPGTLVILISDFLSLDKECEKELSHLSSHCDLLFVQVFDPLEKDIPATGFLPVSKGDQIVTINTRSAQARKKYHDWYESRQSHLESLARSYRAPLMKVSTQEESSSQLRRMISGLF